MAVVQKGAISFGLVYIPVSLYSATQDGDIGFNQLHKADKSRIRYKKVCGHCGKEVEAKDIVRGFEYAKDKYVIVTDEEIEALKTQKDRTITILSFTGLDEISPIYYDRSYYVVPQKGGGKALELLRQAMLNTQRAALGKTVLGNSEKLLVILPREDGMLIQTLLYQDEIKEIPVDYDRPKATEAELAMAEQLIHGMEEPFAPEKYHDEFREKLKALIADKIAGKAVVEAKEEKVGAVVDLMEALKASVKGMGVKKPAKSVAQKSAPPKTRVPKKKEA